MASVAQFSTRAARLSASVWVVSSSMLRALAWLPAAKMRAISSSASKGLCKKSSTPLRKAVTSAETPSRAVERMTAV
jgi:hypothetical protein